MMAVLRRIAALEREKKLAMQNDEFERCAEIRDEIQTVRCCPCPPLPLPSGRCVCWLLRWS